MSRQSVKGANGVWSLEEKHGEDSGCHTADMIHSHIILSINSGSRMMEIGEGIVDITEQSGLRKNEKTIAVLNVCGGTGTIQVWVVYCN